jgi:thiamine-monophosphate kinase
MDTEAQLIKRIARAIPSDTGPFTKMAGRGGGRLRLGIGDDAAIVVPNGRGNLIWTCDALLEGAHFLGDTHPPDSVGYKSVVRATSDVAAMGGLPRLFLLTLALPSSRTTAWLDGFLRGMGRAARELGIRLAGGDTTKAPLVFISITVLGDIAPGLAVLRSGARPGDLVYVSGRLGRAQLGLELVRKGFTRRARDDRRLRQFLQPHLYPKIRIELGAWLARNKVASAMIDISDGLSTDLRHVCAESGVGARVWAERVPRVEIPATAERAFGRRHLDPLQMALHGGEDYELLFTVPSKHAKRLRRAPEYSDLTAIGEITRGKRVVLVGADGRVEPLVPGGWDPFREK